MKNRMMIDEFVSKAHSKIGPKQDLIKQLHLVFPREFIEELERFKKANCISVSYTIHEGEKMVCCQDCFKAHALKVAQDMNCPQKLQKYLSLIIPGEIGHAGYYLNEDTMVKLP